MMLQWRPPALADFEALVDYIAQDDPVAALQQGDAVEAAVDRLNRHPEMGRAGRV